jgi:pimeloyl-ACP methyl ester carboxylesterase
MFAAQKTALEGVGARVQTASFLGHDSIEAMAAAALTAAPSGPMALVGFSMGGIVAMDIIRQAPQRVCHLALLNATPFQPAAPEARRAQIKRAKAGDFAAVLREELKPAYLGQGQHTEMARALIAMMALEAGAEIFSRHSEALLARRCYLETLKSFDGPALMLTGELDTLCPAAVAREAAAALRNSRLCILPSIGHFSPLEAPEAVSEALLDLYCIGSTRAQNPIRGAAE